MLVRVRRFHSTQRDTLEDYFVHDGPIVPSAMLIRASVFEDVGLFDATMKVSEDTEMCLRIAERWQFQHVPGGLTRKRRHGRNATNRLDVFILSRLCSTIGTPRAIRRWRASSTAAWPFATREPATIAARRARIGVRSACYGRP